MDGVGEDVDPEDRDVFLTGPGHEVFDGGVVHDGHVAVGDHGAAAVPAAAAYDVHGGRVECVGVAYHGADVEVVLPVFDGDVEWVAARIEVGDDRVVCPVPVLVEDVAAVAVSEEFGVPVGAFRVGTFPRADTDDVLRCFGAVVLARGAVFARGLVLAHETQLYVPSFNLGQRNC